jgi:lysozyme
MKPSINAINLIKEFEGFYSTAYLCPANVETIGFGTVRYKNGNKVKLGERITMKEAEDELMFELEKIAINIKAKINQNQFDALCSFTYNLGIGALLNSTLYKKVRLNPEDQTIKDEFLRWNKARVGGKLVVLRGLTRRRIAESNLYFKK